MTYLQEGSQAPAFTLCDQNGQRVSLSDFSGKKVLVYFYPKAMTPGCKVQACGLRDSQAELAAGRALVRDAARKYDATGAAALEASCAKYFCTEMAGRVADRAVQIHGGAGYMADYAVERFYRDVRLFRIYEGTTQIQQIVIARELARQAAQS